jgi:hypothetical protein
LYYRFPAASSKQQTANSKTEKWKTENGAAKKFWAGPKSETGIRCKQQTANSKRLLQRKIENT